jgi:hypothetical protein
MDYIKYGNPNPNPNPNPTMDYISTVTQNNLVSNLRKINEPWMRVDAAVSIPCVY